MRGKRTKWIFGTDHAGIATQVKVEQRSPRRARAQGGDRSRGVRRARLGVARASTARRSRSSSSALGASLDYADERFTMDDAYARAVAHVFVALYEKGLIYRDNYMVNWDPGTALGDLRPRGRAARGRGHALHDRLPARVGLGVDHRRDRASRDDARRHRDRGEPGRRALHAPDRRGRRSCRSSAGGCAIIADEYVKTEFGTGALKITPGHDPNDFEIGRKHGLEEISVIGEDGRMTEAAGERFAGLTVDEARSARSSPRCARRA